MRLFDYTPALRSCALITLVILGPFSYSQVFTTAESSTPSSRDSLDVLQAPELPSRSYEVNLWANSTSNVITAGFMQTLGHGGFISHEALDPILYAHNGQKGYLGGNAGWEVSWVGRHNADKPWTLCGSMGSEVIVDTRWTSQLFELLWYGNASSTGEVNMLSGSGARLGAFNRFSLGAENFKTKQRIELGLVQRLAGAEWSLPYGYLYVSENADSLESYLQTEARIHAGADTTFLPAYGIGISGNVPLRFDGIPVELDISFKDVGLLFEPEGSRVYWFQEGITTTGLPAIGDSLTWENIIEGEVSTDSLLHTGESVSRMVLLPSKLAINFRYQHTEQMTFNARIAAGGWMPQNLLSFGVEWKRDDKISFGVDMRDGGWGDQRIGVWAMVKVTKGRSLFLYFEDPKGLFFESESAVNTTCRGVSFRLSKDNG